MSQWIVYAVVTAIAAVVVLSGAATKNKADQTVVSTLQARSGKKISLDVAAMIERDLRNVGSNFPAYDVDPDSSVIAWEINSSVNFIEFFAQAVPGEAPVVIRYQWEIADSTIVEGVLTPLFRISRLVNGKVIGLSTAIFTSVAFDLLTDSGAPATVPGEIRKIGVRIKSISPLGASGPVKERRWNAVYRPHAMARNDNFDV